MSEKSNIVLVGLMGSGKTTIGRLLANKLSLSFVDIDCEIEKSEEMLISKIFESKGELYFRFLETQFIKKYTKLKNQVISTGGGALQKQENYNLLRTGSTIIYLKASVETLYQRIVGEIDNRPILKTDNPRQKLLELLKIREVNYFKSDITIDTDLLSPDEVLNKIVLSIER